MSYKDKISKKLEARKSDNAFRTLSIREGLIDFFSNDYLGFARNKDLQKEIYLKQLQHNPEICNGSTGSRLLSGNSALAEFVEKYLAGFFKVESTLIFNSGYTANVGVLSAIPQKGDTILYDELIHTSLKDGARLSFADRISFRHNDLEDFERKIKKSKGDIFVVLESIYSMDGDKASLKDIIRISKHYNACIILDEAHSTGTCGKIGQGLALAEGVAADIDIRIHTFGKAMGIHGACVAASKEVINYLINFSRPFIYTTAFSPHSFLSVQVAFKKLEQSTSTIEALNKNIQLLSVGLHSFEGYTSSSSPIHVLKVGGTDNVKRIAEEIQRSGFDVRPILSPTVKKGEERLRLCVHAFNSEVHIEELLLTLRKQV